jgi:hypothetical protein
MGEALKTIPTAEWLKMGIKKGLLSQTPDFNWWRGEDLNL